MPTDLTGTPTSLGIGTYNVDADAPSGLGFNAAMGQIDTLLAARVTTPGGIAAGEAMIWNGSAWVRSSTTPLTANGIGPGVVKSPYRKNSIKAVANTTVETDLLNGEITLGANVLGANGVLRLTASGTTFNNSGSTQNSPAWTFHIGSTTCINTNGLVSAWANSANLGSFKIVVEVTNMGATNSQRIQYSLEWANSLASGVVVSAFIGQGIYGTTNADIAKAVINNTSTVDTTVAQSLVLGVALPVANANVSTGLTSAIVEIL